MKTILIVDDEADVLTYLETLFSDAGYRIVACTGGAEALRAAKETPPDLVCLDITMPKPTGIRVYRELREDPALRHIPVVIVTAVTGARGTLDEFSGFLSSRKAVPPPDGFIAKPVDRDELLGKVKALIG